MFKALYFSVLYSFLKGDIESTRMYFDFLREESKVKKATDAFDITQLRKLKEIREALSTGTIASKKFIDQELHAEEKPEEDTTIRQTELVRKIDEEGLNDLKEIMKKDDFTLYNLEHPCAEYGRVDMVYSARETYYPLEVKIREGRHDLIGQIEKYVRHFMLYLHYGIYKEVCGITVCRSYEGYVLDELKRIGVIPLKYYFSGKKLRIRTA